MARLNIPEKIKQARKLTGESQEVFGERFNVSSTAVSLWESGKREAPYKAIEFVISKTSNYEICPNCKGDGVVRKKHE
jgi:transcriptional regulator with XRE-family HTH domain